MGITGVSCLELSIETPDKRSLRVLVLCMRRTMFNFRISWIYFWQESSQTCKLLLLLLLSGTDERLNLISNCLNYIVSQQQRQICWKYLLWTKKRCIFTSLLELSPMDDYSIHWGYSAYGSIAQCVKFCAWVMLCCAVVKFCKLFTVKRETLEKRAVSCSQFYNKGILLKVPK